MEGGVRFQEFWAKCNTDKIESTSMDVGGVLGLELSSEQRSRGFGVGKKSGVVELWSCGSVEQLITDFSSWSVPEAVGSVRPWQ